MRLLLLLASFASFSIACGGPDVRRFPLADPVWVDPDESPLEEPPKEYFSGFIWDAIDMTFFEPTSGYLPVDVLMPAPNVNAFDEVPNSSWFTNRLSLFDMSIEELRQGSCPGQGLDLDGPWTVVAAKPNGTNPGFIMRDAEGRGWLLKFNGVNEGIRATTADVFGSRIYDAAGYFSPCNVVVFFDPEILEIGAEAETEDDVGNDIPMEQHHIQQVLDAAFVLEDPERVCVSLVGPDGERPEDAGSADSAERYVVVDLHLVPQPGMEDAIPPARLHLYDLGSDGFRLVGIERPGDAQSPAE